MKKRLLAVVLSLLMLVAVVLLMAIPISAVGEIENLAVQAWDLPVATDQLQSLLAEPNVEILSEWAEIDVGFDEYKLTDADLNRCTIHPSQRRGSCTVRSYCHRSSPPVILRKSRLLRRVS